MDNYDISVPDEGLRGRWLICVLVGSSVPRLNYWSKKSDWQRYVSDAETWATKDGADTVAASIILSNPEHYFGKVEVRRLV